jgi:hypothetical protein
LATCKDVGQAVAFGELSVILGVQEIPRIAPIGGDSRWLGAENGSLAIRAVHLKRLPHAYCRVWWREYFSPTIETLALLHLDRTNWEGLYPFRNNGVTPCIVAHG